ncbi:prephenate/arogenate dehydrogenase [Sphaerothrix gracilis]|uniref:prephenate/arogenate dehydrogenase n=1 Tax=Sphaerothrix gracilis TaxID=3151835 RepID=UPI0031FCF041
MKIGIVGLGLIGGSLGLDLRQQGHEVIGISRRAETGDLALQRGVVDAAATSLEAVAAAELIFVCTPIAAIAPTIQQLALVLPHSAVITDVGSVKTHIVEAASAVWPNFVGGHPMAGKATAGLAVAEAGLFNQRPYVLTPTALTPPAAMALVLDVVEALGCYSYRCAPETHDRAVAWISHLPVMISSGLIQACLSETDAAVLQLAQQLASSGFRDTSRVGGGNPELGLMMAQFNQSALLQALHGYRQQLDQMIEHITAQNWTALQAALQQSQQARPQFVEPLNDLSVDKQLR